MKLVDSPTAQNLEEETVLQALHAETNNWAVVTKNAAAEAWVLIGQLNAM